MNEFELIQRYFTFSSTPDKSWPGLTLGVGDDAALVDVGGATLAVATDTLVAGVHFPENFPAGHIASRALGVNLSDFAAMGAIPKWITLALTLPEPDVQWLDNFAAQLALGCEQYGIALIGGDTTRGALTVTLTVLGDAGKQPLRRSGAQAGDDIWVSGQLGEGAAALHALTEGLGEREHETLLQGFYAPPSRLALGQQLQGLASSAIDVSDGLLADCEHLAQASGISMVLQWYELPVHADVDALAGSPLQVMEWVLAGGDEYELLFTAPPSRRERLAELSGALQLPLARIGQAVDTGDNSVVVEGFPAGLDAPGHKGHQHFT